MDRSKEAQEERKEYFDKLLKSMPPMAGQRRSREEEEEQQQQVMPPEKQVREDEEKEDNQQEGMEIEQDIDKLYLVDDQLAYQREREIDKGKRFFIQRKMVEAELEKAKKRQENKNSEFHKVILRASDNKHAFSIEDIALQVLKNLEDMEIEIDISDIAVSAFGTKGPYVVALRSKLGALSLQEEGMILTELQINPPVKQFFEVSPYNANEKEIKASSSRDQDIAMSIFYKLGNEYTGLRLDKNQLDEPKERIMKEITKVFGEASDILQYSLIQPRTECGVIRNDLRVIIKYNKLNESKVEPEVEKLADLKYISLGFGKRPLVATLPSGWRAAYGVQACCFRQECEMKEGKCTARDKAWSLNSYSESARWKYYGGTKNHGLRSRTQPS